MNPHPQGGYYGVHLRGVQVMTIGPCTSGAIPPEGGTLTTQLIEYWISYNDSSYKVAHEQYEDLRISCAGPDSDSDRWAALTPATKTPIRGWKQVR